MTNAAVTQFAIEARDVTKDYQSGGSVVHALRGITLSMKPGELVALRGRSGSGKTTLLNLLVGLDMPTSGSVTLLGHDLAKLNDDQRADLRRGHVGLMFQNAHLFPSLTAQENVEILLRFARMPTAERERRATAALERVKLSKRAKHRGLELSGGEQQRVALARALVHSPQFVIADEPTGNLDTLTGREIIALLREIAHDSQIAFLIATHDAMVVTAADRVLQMSDGLITEA